MSWISIAPTNMKDDERDLPLSEIMQELKTNFGRVPGFILGMVPLPPRVRLWKEPRDKLVAAEDGWALENTVVGEDEFQLAEVAGPYKWSDGGAYEQMIRQIEALHVHTRSV